MSDEELNRISAERFCDSYEKEYSVQWAHFGEKTFAVNEYDEHSFDLWNPTSPDSNQAERYLFPKVQKYVDIRISFDDDGYQIIVYEENGKKLFRNDYAKPDEINRTKVTAALMALDELGKE